MVTSGNSAFRIPHSALGRSRLSPSLLRRARAIRLLVLDVDGILTDGRLLYTAAGDEVKAFHILDGHGLKLGLKVGLSVALVTGRRTDMVARRARELGIGLLFEGVEEKLPVFRELLDRTGLPPFQVAWMGDDLPDLLPMRQAGLAISVPDGAAEVRAVAHYLTRRPAGGGAVREAVELLLKAQGHWQAVVEGVR
jgi:3-deoxy-D-manno-octulosonate 8-phosphate phosphatase (KDO 8-P phosphatase)